MSEETTTQVDETTENDNSTDSSSEETATDNTLSPDGDNNQDDNKPFHEHPRWKQRESEWDKRFNEQEARHQEDLRKLREEFGGSKATKSTEKKDLPPPPPWFGGDEEAWAEFNNFQEEKLTLAEQRALERLKSEQQAQEKAEREATEYMQSEFSAIESDATLNPTGAKLDPNKLLKYTIDNKFVDIDTGKWDYRRAWKFLQLEDSSGKPDTGTRKAFAASTTIDSKGEAKPTSYKTNADFRKNKPW